MSMVTKVKSLAARATMPSDDVRALLEKDHDEALALTKEMQDEPRSARRKTLFAKLKPALVSHSRAEEKVVYDALLALKKAQAGDAHDMANEGYVEHGLLDQLLAELTRTDASSDTWKAQAKVLHEILGHHVEEEQSDMFADLGESFSYEELQTLGAKFLRAKQRTLEALARKSDAAAAKTLLGKVAKKVADEKLEAAAQKSAARKTAARKAATRS